MTVTGVTLAGGIAVAVGLAVATGLPAREAAWLFAITAGVSAVLAVVGRLVLRRRPRPMQIQVVIVAVTAALVLTGGVAVAAQAMFLSSHDRDVLLVVVTLATTASLVAAQWVGSGFGADADMVVQLSDDVGRPRPTSDQPVRLHSKEMTVIAARLAEADARVETSRQRERAVEASRRELVAWVSHDLRGPLASIRALAEALDDQVVVAPDDVARYHRAVRLESERLSTLVDDLFELSRLHAGAVRTDTGTMEIDSLISAAVAGVDTAAEAKGIRLLVRVDAVGTVTVPATDALRIVRNLLDNAVRHTPPGGTVTLESRSDDGAVILSVIDECGGIPDGDLGRVFDLAFRGDAARQRDGSSGGLGLTIAKGLAEAHAGTLDVGNIDTGCRFQLRIPATR